MRRVVGREALAAATFSRPVVAIGVFDGVHRGHRHVLEALRAFADEAGGESVVVTFDTHPRALLEGRAPRPLVPLAYRLLLLERLGVDSAVVLPFDEALRDTPHDTFVAEVLVGRIGVRGLLFGYDTTFGKGGLGTFDAVAPLALRHGFAVRRAPAITVQGLPVSAQRIRDAIEAGALELASALLGRPASVLGTVVEGDGRGRTLGFPTANVDVGDVCLPPCGVYQVVATVRGHRCAAVANLGVRPTFDDARPGVPRPAGSRAELPRLEVHVPGLASDLYGEAFEVEWVRKLRDERRFPTREALVEQIRRDVSTVTGEAPADGAAGGDPDAGAGP